VGSHAKAGLAATPAMPRAMAADSAVRLIEWFMNAPPEEWFTNCESGFFICNNTSWIFKQFMHACLDYHQ
jgi:hypothetical protein